jgi:hypothetical protein
VNAADVSAALRAAADRLAGHLAVWAERDPAEPLKFQPEALARVSAEALARHQAGRDPARQR